jgi:DNA (cytosine-5)-methyltransferase 1
MRNKKVKGVDLFCGAGGTSAGIIKAVKERLKREIDLIAVNHWTTAINTHSLNHPFVRHICETVENLHPRSLVPGGYLDILAASCECTFHSNARGGGPCNEQSRSQPWQIIRWATDLDIANILMENVIEFKNWGPLYPCTCGTKNPKKHRKGSKCLRPIPERKGEFFNAFLAALKNLGYQVEWRRQVAADFGDATTRPRFMLIARKYRPLIWPEPTHGEGRPNPWKSARNHVIDWSIPGRDIYRPDGTLRHCANTMKRIEKGFQKQGAKAEPFLIYLRGTSESHINSCSRHIDEPLPSLTANGNHMMLVQPFIVQTDHQSAKGSYTRSVDQPIPSVVTKQNLLLVEPMVMKYYKTGICKSVDLPLDSVTTKARFLLVEPVSGESVGIGVRTRILNPKELAASHSFPKTYKFAGNISDQTKQVGNSVPVELAAAHAEAALS